MRGLPTSILLLFCLLGSVSCASSNPEPDPLWQGTEVEVASDRVLWKIALFSCRKVGFPLPTALDPATMEIDTAWRNDLQPFRGQGNRTQAQIQMTPAGPGRWHVQTRVKRQRNMALQRPLELDHADWEWVDDDIALARILLQHIRSYVDPTIEARERPDDEIEAFLRRAGLDED
jgi:hypothetical protein